MNRKSQNMRFWLVETFLGPLREILESRFIIQQLVKVELNGRYRRTFLGYTWTLLNPLFSMSVLAVVFSTLFGIPFKEFALFLFSGMVPWLMFSNTINKSLPVFVEQEALIKMVHICKSVFPVASAVSSFIDSIFSFFALLLLIFIFGGKFSIALLCIPLAFLLLFVFCLGIGFITSILSTTFRDLTQIIPILIQIAFFLTPIIYKPESLRGKVEFLMQVNPLVPFLEVFRTLLITGEIPPLSIWATIFAISLVSMGVGFCVYQLKKDELVFSL